MNFIIFLTQLPAYKTWVAFPKLNHNLDKSSSNLVHKWLFFGNSSEDNQSPLYPGWRRIIFRWTRDPTFLSSLQQRYFMLLLTSPNSEYSYVWKILSTEIYSFKERCTPSYMNKSALGLKSILCYVIPSFLKKTYKILAHSILPIFGLFCVSALLIITCIQKDGTP